MKMCHMASQGKKSPLLLVKFCSSRTHRGHHKGSSLLMRGHCETHGLHCALDWSIPACAGKTARRLRRGAALRNHPPCAGKTIEQALVPYIPQEYPRLRGEDVDSLQATTTQKGVPSPARGRLQILHKYIPYLLLSLDSLLLYSSLCKKTTMPFLFEDF